LLFPAVIPAAFSLSGGRYGSGEGDGPRNRRADVYSLGSCPPRVRFCSSPLLGGGARVCAPVVAGGAWVPGVDGEAVATAALWNKSSRTRPRPCGVSLRRHWWVCGGGAPVVELLFQGSSPAACCPALEVSSLAFCLVDRGDASGLVEVRRVERVQSSCGGSGRQRRICFHGHRGSGCVPGRWSSRGGFRSSLVAVVLCGPFQSFIAMGFRLAMGSRRSIPAAAAVRRWRNLEHRGSRDLVVFSHFLWTFVQFVWWCRCPLYPAKMYLYLYCYLYRIF